MAQDDRCNELYNMTINQENICLVTFFISFLDVICELYNLLGSAASSVEASLLIGMLVVDDRFKTGYLGVWKIVAKFTSNPQQSYSADFEVKEYVLPSFEVKLTPRNRFFYVDSESLTVDIKATYLFGEKVDGTAYVVFGVIHKDDKKQIFSSSLQRVDIRNGEGHATLTKEHITNTEKDINRFVGSSILVSVSVLTESGSEMVEAELRGIQIVTSPYAIHFRRTPKYYKPGMSFDVTVEVLNPDETPASNVPVVVTPGPVNGITTGNGMARLTINTAARDGQLTITKDGQTDTSRRIDTLPHAYVALHQVCWEMASPRKGYVISLAYELVMTLIEIDDLLSQAHSDTIPSNSRWYLDLAETAKTKDSELLDHRQASSEMRADPYRSKSDSFIHIGVDAAELTIGQNLKINLILNKQQNKDITYLIQARGQLVKFGRYKTKDQVLISLIEPITKEMLPSFRIIAYYHPSPNEVVSDSIWVDVKDTCMGTLRLEPSRPEAAYEPRQMFGLKVTGDPGAKVGLVAVDKGVYVLSNKHRLTQKKVWDIVEKSDTGCTSGGGKDGLSVFFDAGLLFESNSASGTADRQELKCGAPSRKKRTISTADTRSNLLSKYKGNDILTDCCMDGMKDNPSSYDCNRRSEYIVDGQACVDAFLFCCEAVKNLRDEKRNEDLKLARSETDDGSFLESDEISTRTNFPESWLWSDMMLPACQQANCRETSSVKDVPLQDSITTWQFTGISLSKSHGICVGEPLEVIVRKAFFIDLRLPYSAVVGEQIEVRAILHNYRATEIQVRLDLTEMKHVCSAAYKRKVYRQMVRVGPRTTRPVPFIIIPMKEGEHAIEVKGAVRDSFLSDGIEKTLRVVPSGVLMKQPQIITLDPTKKGKDGVQEEIISSKIPKSDVVPNTPTSTQISVTGREQVGFLVENAISGKSMGSLIRQPGGCGEQNMIHMTLPVIATTYLDKTNQWETVGFQKRDEAIQHIREGYTNELAYRKKDGSFAVWAKYQSSTWLTAYVAKVFAMANHLIAVQHDVTCNAVEFLILNAQQPDGIFKEVGKVYHTEMTGDVTGKDSDASMTAFCLIAMQESRRLCSETVNSLSGSIDKAVGYLERRLPNLTNPYAVAMTSYALANENKLNKEILYKFLSPELSHWHVPKGPVYTLEATAYALLALVKVKAFEDARPVVRWFNQQQKVGGGYGSTQATILVYQAVAEYWTNAKEPDYDLNVDILLPGRSSSNKYHFNQDNHYATRTSKINDINQNVTVTARGTGEATVTMVSLYYAKPSATQSDCTNFDLSVNIEPVETDPTSYKLKIEVLYKNKDHDAGMSILDIGLLTGYTADPRDLELLSTGRARQISKYEINKVLSEKGSLIIYLDKVSHKRREEISFKIKREWEVGVLQPAAVSVYEYYEQKPCVKFYHPQRAKGQLLKICRQDNVCTCAEENCSMQKKGNIKNDIRTEKICESTETSKINYAYKVHVEQFAEEMPTDTFTVRVLEVIKEGTADVAPETKVRTFTSYMHCREALNLEVGKTYLIMGSDLDIHRNDKQNTFQYMLGENTWAEYWPTSAECQTPGHQFICRGLEEMIDQYKIFNCIG
ncbi:complement C3-like [Pholidichthys leucotaenia]